MKMEVFPIVVEYDLMQLVLVKADSRGRALVRAAEQQLVVLDSDKCRISPEGVKGEGTPSASLEIWEIDSLEKESVLVVLTCPDTDNCEVSDLHVY